MEKKERMIVTESFTIHLPEYSMRERMNARSCASFVDDGNMTRRRTQTMDDGSKGCGFLPEIMKTPHTAAMLRRN